MTFQPVNSLLSWFIGTEWKQFSTIYALCFTYWHICGLTNSPIVKYPLNWGWCAWSTEGSLKQWLPNGKLLLLFLTKCHGVPCSLPSRITTKVLEKPGTFSSRPRPRPRPNVQDQDFMIQDQDFHFYPLGASRPRLWSRGLHHWSLLNLCAHAGWRLEVL